MIGCLGRFRLFQEVYKVVSGCCRLFQFVSSCFKSFLYWVVIVHCVFVVFTCSQLCYVVSGVFFMFALSFFRFA